MTCASMLGCQIRFYLIRLEKCSGLGSGGRLRCRLSSCRQPEEQSKGPALTDETGPLAHDSSYRIHDNGETSVPRHDSGAAGKHRGNRMRTSSFRSISFARKGCTPISYRCSLRSGVIIARIVMIGRAGSRFGSPAAFLLHPSPASPDYTHCIHLSMTQDVQSFQARRCPECRTM